VARTPTPSLSSARDRALERVRLADPAQPEPRVAARDPQRRLVPAFTSFFAVRRRSSITQLADALTGHFVGRMTVPPPHRLDSHDLNAVGRVPDLKSCLRVGSYDSKSESRSFGSTELKEWSNPDSPRRFNETGSTLSGVACPTSASFASGVGSYRSRRFVEDHVDHWNGPAGNHCEPERRFSDITVPPAVTCPFVTSCFAVVSLLRLPRHRPRAA